MQYLAENIVQKMSRIDEKTRKLKEEIRRLQNVVDELQDFATDGRIILGFSKCPVKGCYTYEVSRNGGPIEVIGGQNTYYCQECDGHFCETHWVESVEPGYCQKCFLDRN